MQLKQLANINAGYPFRGKIPEVANSGILAVQMKNTSPEDIRWSNCIETEPSGKRQPDWLQAGDILFVARGNHNYAVLVDKTPVLPSIAAPHFFVISSTTPTVLPQFLTWQLNQAPCQRYLEQHTEGTLTKSIRKNVLEDLPVTIPDIHKQQSIINLADTIRQEQHIAEQIIRNGQQLLNTIAHDIIHAHKRT
ncbi:MAG: restriction endonuclease subunit S [Methylococcales bacterium]|jgi:restriction endonuclease S subunit|nr:restriction endonuclease subunit S [Methylococcales bacterium]MBT7442967.1 restriction endonuclease subunit S [Methylococcales bacterium]